MIRHVGAKEPAAGRAPQQVLADAELTTSGADGMTVNVAVGYGGRREIVDAVRALVQD